MKKPQNKIIYFFVDESGDPYFYDRKGNFIVGKEGCSKILILGFIKTEMPEIIRSRLNGLKTSIKNDKYLQSIPSIEKSLKYLHATDDCPEVREKVFKEIVAMPFKAEFIVARKLEDVFIKRHKSKPNLFYDDLIYKLFQNQLHTSKKNVIYFAVRTNRARQMPLEDSIHKAILTFENKWNTKIDSDVDIFPQRPDGEPCLQVTDYMNWAIQRLFVKREVRYFEFIRRKVSLITDIYDFDKYPKNYYNRKNVLGLNKISPL